MRTISLSVEGNEAKTEGAWLATGLNRAVVRRSLRPRLRWLADHPRLLKLVYRAVPSWKPGVAWEYSSTPSGGVTMRLVPVVRR